MEKILKPYDKEFMRMAMLKHEQTFKEQVYELHRLYHIQKILMKSSHNKQHSSRSTKLDLEQAAGDDEDPGEAKGRETTLEMMDESEIELTLGPSNYSACFRKKPQNSPSFSSSSTGSSQINITDNHHHHQQQQQQSSSKHPTWLLQVLSLNMSS